MKYDRDILVDNINILISDNNITQSDLAKIIGTHQSRLSECLNKKKDFTLPQVVAIADYFKISIDDLLNRPSRAISSPDTLSELCEYLFALTDSVCCDISHQNVSIDKLPKGLYEKLEHKKINEISIDKNTCPEFISIPSLTFFSESIITFLNEWENARSFLKFTNGMSLYETWKEGILSKYKNHLKIYQYTTERQYVDELIIEKFCYCLNCMDLLGYKDLENFTTEPTLKADWRKFSEDFNKSRSDTDRKLLERVDNVFNDWSMLSDLPILRFEFE